VLFKDLALQMLEKTDGDLIIGEFYYIKNHITRVSIGKAKFTRKTPNGIIIHANFGPCLIHPEEWTFYRYISQKEYKEKLREKYDLTCLNIVLKQLINESFSW
jgi:hypothetical protein